MTPIERTVDVLNRWCGENAVNHTDEKLEDLWNRTKPTGKPSHNAIDFWEQGAEDLFDRLIAEFKKDPARNLNFDHTDLNPTGGGIITADDLFKAVLQSPEVTTGVTLSKASHAALVKDITAALSASPKKVGEKKATARKRGQ
ncbi:MAG: hypothetical protein LAP61_23195 [Acidobacteriia bacterium]|nr:hypothetical protein [Terriglobia bacterium]